MKDLSFVNQSGAILTVRDGFVGLGPGLSMHRTAESAEDDGRVELRVEPPPAPMLNPLVTSKILAPTPIGGQPPATFWIVSSLGSPGFLMRPDGAVEVGFYDRVSKTGGGIGFNGAGARPPVLLSGDWNLPADRQFMVEQVVLHAILIGLADAADVKNLPAFV